MPTAPRSGQPRPPNPRSDETHRAYELESPAFDPVLSRAESAMGRFAETVRTWPSAQGSRHPVGSFAAVGPQAAWLIADQRLDEGYGPDSPLERLVEVDGLVLLLGAPLDTVTLLHYAEYLADLPEKRWTQYHMPVVVDGERRWRLIRELDSSRGAFDYARLGLQIDAFEAIVGTALKSGIGVSSTIGAATTHLIPARSLVEFAVTWMEEHFAT